MSFTVQTLPRIIDLARNRMVVKTSDTGYPTQFDDYYIELELLTEFVYRTNIFLPVPGKIKGRQKDGVVVFDISRFLMSKIPAESIGDAFSVQFDGATRVTNSILRYKLKMTEHHGPSSSGTSGYTFTTDILVAMRGGRHRQSDSLSIEFDFVYPGQRFLTHAPETRRVSARQPLWLYYNAGPTAGTYSVKVTRYYTDGSSDDFTVNPLNNQGYDLFRWPVGYDQLNLESGATGEIKSWTVVVVSNNAFSELSEVREYVLDYNCPPNERYYLFENSFGVIDTVRTTGELSLDHQNTSQTVRRGMDLFRNKDQPDIIKFNSEHYDICTQYCGHIDPAEVDWLRDLLRSERVWRLGDAKPKPEVTRDMWPIVIDDGKTRISQDNNFLYSLRFSYRDAFITPAI